MEPLHRHCIKFSDALFSSESNATITVASLRQGDQPPLTPVFAQVERAGIAIASHKQATCDGSSLSISSEAVPMPSTCRHEEIKRGRVGRCYFCESTLRVKLRDRVSVLDELLRWAERKAIT